MGTTIPSDRDDTPEIDRLYKEWLKVALEALSHKEVAGDFSLELFAYFGQTKHGLTPYTSEKVSKNFELGIIHTVNAKQKATKAWKLSGGETGNMDLLEVYLYRFDEEIDDRAILDPITVVKGRQSGTFDKGHLRAMLEKLTREGEDYGKDYYDTLYNSAGVPPQGTSTTNGSYILYWEYQTLYN